MRQGHSHGRLLVRGRFGVTRIVEMLRGSRSKGLLAYGAEDCPGYGMYQTWTKTALTRW